VGGVADILRGRCLSYGEGITYWPLIEILIAIGVEPDSVIGGSPPETQLAFRKLLEARATERPQVVVIDDLHWAEPVFVDLVEHIADLSRDAPIFLLCVARNELLDVRPGWGGGKVNATSLLLEPLAPEECFDLMDRLGPGAVLDPGLRERITDASAGNPLYVEEMVAMVREHGGDGEIVVPPTIQALLQARIDVLDGDVRVVMERGSVEGEVFHRGAVAALSPASVKGAVEAHLATLVRKELIRSTPSTFPMDEGFRFRHLLIRDAAYESLPKATRAELHEQLADWLSRRELIEEDEIVGYHLERAHRYRAELNPSDDALPRLAARASERLAAAGAGALDRADFHAGISLLRRASAVLAAGDPRRLALAPELAAALGEAGSIDEALEILAEASAAEDEQIRARAAVTRAILRQQPVAGGEAVRETFERAGDEYGLALYWWSMAWDAWARVLVAETAEACELALACLARAGLERGRVADSIRARLVSTYIFGPIHVDEAIDRTEALIAEETGQVALAYARVVLGRLYAMRAEFDKARELVAGARQAYRDAGMLVVAGALSMYESRVEWAAGNIAAADGTLEEGLALLEEIGDRGFHATVALMLAELRYVRGRYDDARALCASARITTEPSDLFNFILLDSIEGCLLAREGRLEEALPQCRRAIEHTEGMDGLEACATPRRYLAEALFLAGQTDDARTVAVEAIAIREAKGDMTGAARTREIFEQIGLAVS
jgi:tetratricopeptide (TPR) repeat protein